MKKSLIPFVIFVLLSGLVHAQEGPEELFSAKLKKDEVPQEIIKAIERDFPNLIASDFRKLPGEFIEGSFFLSADANEEITPETIYYIEMSSPRLKAEATYKGSGQLISAREYLKNVPLPLPVERNLFKDYPGWTPGKDHELLTINRDDQQTAYYRVQITKRNEKMWVTYNSNGTETKAGMKHRLHEMNNMLN